MLITGGGGTFADPTSMCVCFNWLGSGLVVLDSSCKVAFHCSVQIAGKTNVGFSNSSPGMCRARLAVRALRL